MYIDPALLGPVSALMGALIGGSTSLVATVYTQRHQDRLQRVASEVTKRERVYADFVMSAFDFRPRAIIEKLNLLRPIYRSTTNYGHFGRPGLPWEVVAKPVAVAR